MTADPDKAYKQTVPAIDLVPRVVAAAGAGEARMRARLSLHDPIEKLFWAFRNAKPGDRLTRQQRAWLDETERVWNAAK